MSEESVDLTPQEERTQTLLAAGLSKSFLQTIATLADREDGLYLTGEDEEGAYFYLKTSEWDDLEGQRVTPVFGTVTGEEFYLLLQKDDENRWVYFSLEAEIQREYDSVEQFLGAFLLEQIQEVEPDEFRALADEIGYPQAQKMLDAWDADDDAALVRLAGASCP